GAPGDPPGTLEPVDIRHPDEMAQVVRRRRPNLGLVELRTVQLERRGAGELVLTELERLVGEYLSEVIDALALHLLANPRRPRIHLHAGRQVAAILAIPRVEAVLLLVEIAEVQPVRVRPANRRAEGKRVLGPEVPLDAPAKVLLPARDL